MNIGILATIGFVAIVSGAAAQAATPMSPAEQYGFDTHCAATALTVQRSPQLLAPDQRIDPTKIAYIVEQTRMRALASGKALSVDAPTTIGKIDDGSTAMAAHLRTLSGTSLIDERTNLGRTIIACALSEAPR